MIKNKETWIPSTDFDDVVLDLLNLLERQTMGAVPEAVTKATMTYRVNFLNEVKTKDYYTEDQDPIKHEAKGIVHNIMKKNRGMDAVWTRDHIECSITMDCQKDTLYRILDSIYVMEDNQ